VSSEWTRYYDAAGDDPRPTLLLALELFERDGVERGDAVDLGCGTGRDTFTLLRRGWTVLAIDAEAEAIDRLLRAAPSTGRLRTQVAQFSDASWPECDLVNSSFALPFCPPADLSSVWASIVASLREGGRFSGHLFGDRDGWAGTEGMTFQTRTQAEEMLRPFEVEHFDEVEEDGHTATGKPKHWHLFHLVARRR
jgi:SAM-dependent methyltransferase